MRLPKHIILFLLTSLGLTMSTWGQDSIQNLPPSQDSTESRPAKLVIQPETSKIPPQIPPKVTVPDTQPTVPPQQDPPIIAKTPEEKPPKVTQVTPAIPKVAAPEVNATPPTNQIPDPVLQESLKVASPETIQVPNPNKLYDSTLYLARGHGKDTLVVLVKQNNGGLLGGLGPRIGASNDDGTGPPSIGELLSFSRILWGFIILIIGYLLIRFLTRTLELLAERSTRARIRVKQFAPMIQIFGWLLIIYIIIAGVIRPPVETIVAVGASLGIAIGFASQDILKNIFAGIVILFDRPFQVGDKIEIGNIYGEVKQIGLRSTRIETADDSLVSVPNAELMNQSVSNSNVGEENCQVVAEIYLPLTIDTERVREIATEAAQVSKFIYLNKPITVLFFNEVKERRSYLKMRLKAYVMDIRYEFAFKSDMTELVIRELLEKEVIQAKDLF